MLVKTMTIILRKNYSFWVFFYFYRLLSRNKSQIPWLEVINLPTHWKEMKNEKIHLLIVFTDLWTRLTLLLQRHSLYRGTHCKKNCQINLKSVSSKNRQARVTLKKLIAQRPGGRARNETNVQVGGRLLGSHFRWRLWFIIV